MCTDNKEEVNVMSELQQKAVQMINGLSDDNVSFLIEIIHRLMPENRDKDILVGASVKEDERMLAFGRLDAAREEIKGYFPDDFNPEKELEEARAERYGSVG